ncbi:MAG: 4a-hydroxytetrahydrobiopterin dehydratase [Ktedonobacterales bacterium]
MAMLHQLQCVACRGDEPGVTAEEQAEYAPQVPEWHTVAHDGVPHLTRTFRFDDFAHALEFTNAVGALAEAEGHHPAILTEWGRVTVEWWTHKIHALHRNDYILAARADLLYANAPGARP